MAIAARCTVIIALNKIDKVPKGQERLSARSRVLAQIVQIGLIPEEYGGIRSDLILCRATSCLKGSSQRLWNLMKSSCFVQCQYYHDVIKYDTI